MKDRAKKADSALPAALATSASAALFFEHENGLCRHLSIERTDRHQKRVCVIESDTDGGSDCFCDERNSTLSGLQVGDVEYKMAAAWQCAVGTLNNRVKKLRDPDRYVRVFFVGLPHIGRVSLSVEVRRRGEDQLHAAGIEGLCRRMTDLACYAELFRESLVAGDGLLFNICTRVVYTCRYCSQESAAVTGTRIPDSSARAAVFAVDEFCNGRSKHRRRSTAKCDCFEYPIWSGRVSVLNLKSDSALQLFDITPSLFSRDVAVSGRTIAVREERYARSDSGPAFGPYLAILDPALDFSETFEIFSDFFVGKCRYRKRQLMQPGSNELRIGETERPVLARPPSNYRDTLLSGRSCCGTFGNSEMPRSSGKHGTLTTGIDKHVGLVSSYLRTVANARSSEYGIKGLNGNSEIRCDLSYAPACTVAGDNKMLDLGGQHLQDSLCDLHFSIEVDSRVSVEKSNDVCRRSAGRGDDAEILFLTSDRDVVPDIALVQERDELLHQGSTATESDSWLIFRNRPDHVAVSVHEAAPEVSRHSDLRCRCPNETFLAHSVSAERLAQRGRSEREPHHGTRFDCSCRHHATPAREVCDFVLGPEIASESVDVRGVSLRKNEMQHRTGSGLVDPAIGEQESDPVGRLGRQLVESLLPVKESRRGFFSITHGAAELPHSAVDVVCTDAEAVGNGVDRVASLVAVKSDLLLLVRQPDPLLHVTSTTQRDGVCQGGLSC